MHIGKLIKLRIIQLGISKAEFARRINKTPQNINDILLRSSVDTALLAIIGNVLGYNFFKVFSDYQKALEELKEKGINPSQSEEIAHLWSSLKQTKIELNDLKLEVSALKTKLDG
jgi:transcriptional regulator with XRE-family HTH domain